MYIIDQEAWDLLVEKHQHYLKRDCADWGKCRMYLQGAIIHNVKSENVDLRDVFIHKSCILSSTFIKVDFRGSSMVNNEYIDSHIIGSVFKASCMRLSCIKNTTLKGSDFSNVNMNDSYLANVEVNNTRFDHAFVNNSKIYDVNFSYASIIGTKFENSEFSFVRMEKEQSSECLNINFHMNCPDTGSFIGWKCAKVGIYGCIVKLEIPEDAKRVSGLTRKCRCDKAKVLEIQALDGTPINDSVARSMYCSAFTYRVGEVVVSDDFCDDRTVSCTHGIHFFITRSEAVQYYNNRL